MPNEEPDNDPQWRIERKWERRLPNGEKIPDLESRRTSSGIISPGTCDRMAHPGIFLSVFLIGAGVLFFLNNIGLVRIWDFWRYWPVILIGLGLAKLSKVRGAIGSTGAIIMMAVGCIFLLKNLGLLHLTAGMVWPLILIGAGVFMLSRMMTRRDFAPPGVSRGPQTDFSDSDKIVREWTMFGGVKRVIDSNDFQGGELMSVFGGVELDLRRAQIMKRDKPVVIDANTSFGGISIKVPDNWRVDVHGVGIFGGYEDKTIRARQSDTLAPRLVITGYAVFGGVVVE